MRKVSIYRDFADLSPAYAELFDRNNSAVTFFSSLYWFRHLARTAFDSHTDFLMYGVESGGTPQIILPLCSQPSSAGLFAPRKLMAIANFYTSLFVPPIEHTLAAAALQPQLDLLAQAIAADQPRWDSIDLHPMAIDAPLFDGLQHAFRSAGMAVQTYFCFGNWYLQVDGRSYRQYFDSLPSRLKNTVTRKCRQLDDAGRLRIDIIHGGEALPDAIAAYEKIYGSSWKKAEPYPEFMRGLIRLCAEQGWLRMGIAYVDDQAAAAQIWIVRGGTASIYKLAYDERFADLSIGSILTARLMRHAIDVDQVREVDYLTGDERYKQDWMSHRRERWGLIAFNLRTPNGLFAAGTHIAGRMLKNALKNTVKRVLPAR